MVRSVRNHLNSARPIPRTDGLFSADAEAQANIAAYFCRMADTIGLPRSTALIYHVLFLASEPVSFGDIVTHSGLSKASASTGLRLLERIHGVKIVIVADDRRTFYTAERSLRRLISGFFQQTIQPGMESASALLNPPTSFSEENLSPLYVERLASLRQWHSLARDLLPLLASFSSLQATPSPPTDSSS